MSTRIKSSISKRIIHIENFSQEVEINHMPVTTDEWIKIAVDTHKENIRFKKEKSCHML